MRLAAETPQRAKVEIARVVAGEFCEPETRLALQDDTLLDSNIGGAERPA